MENKRTLRPKWYGIVAVVSLLWNLMGLGTFFQFVFITPETFRALSLPEQQLQGSYPLWTIIAFGIAVFGGTIGSIGLGMAKKWALYAFSISLMAIIPQMTFNLFYTNQSEVYGPSSAVMPIAVIVFGIFLVVFSLFAYKKNWLR